uniref:RNA exonuclease 2 n=1 Tax=Phasianus colchicus TaxID=9054 RepID=A0A669Q5D8_PHACC
MTVPLRCVADDGPGCGEGPDPGDGLPHHRLRPQRAGRGPQSDHQTARRAAGRHVRVVQGAPRQAKGNRQRMDPGEGQSNSTQEVADRSGLTKAVKESKISLQQAEYEFLSFVRQQTPPGLCPLAGNSVHADKKFLDKYMPQFMRHLHYRIIDVSTVKELCRRWYPEEYEFAPKKAASHRALDDIRESIKELQFYRDSIFKRKTDEKKRKLIENGESDKTAS